MTVSGAGVPTAYVNGTYNYWDQFNGKPRYAGGPDDCYIEWDGIGWWINCVASGGSEYFSNQDVASPELVTNWVDNGYGSVSMPTVSGSVNQEPTLTPTFHPLFPTPTPPAPGDYRCPGYQPIGAGSVTPSAGWSLHCAQCITPIPRYTWPTLPVLPTTNWTTPMPTATATPSPSGALTVYQDVGLAMPHIGPNVVFTHNSILKRSFGTSFHNDNQAIWPGLPKTFGVHFWGTTTITRQSGVATINLNFRVARFHNVDVEIVESSRPVEFPVGTIYHFNAPDGMITVSKNLATIGSSWSTTQSWDIKFNVTVLSRTFPWYEEFFAHYVVPGGQLSAMTTEYNMEYQLDHWVDPMPITSNCSTVQADPGGGINDPDDPNFKLPYIGVGAGSCTGIPAITIGTSWLQIFFSNAPDSLSFGGVQFCFAPISFGALNIFGIPIDLDLMAMVMAGVLMFKVITR